MNIFFKNLWFLDDYASSIIIQNQVIYFLHSLHGGGAAEKKGGGGQGWYQVTVASRQIESTNANTRNAMVIARIGTSIALEMEASLFFWYR